MSIQPVCTIYQDSKVLVVQTLAYADDLAMNEEILVQMLTENQPSYGMFNLGLHVKDEPQQVLENRCRLIAMLNQSVSDNLHSLNNINSDIKVQQIHWLDQVHGNTVLDIDSRSNTIKMSSADALSTVRKGQALAIMTADCVPIMLYCPDSGRIAGIHAGWHGLANGVIAKTIKSFYHEAPNIKAWIGACISCDHYEVSVDIVEQLVRGTVDNFCLESDHLSIRNMDILTQQITKPHPTKGKSWVDLPLLAKIQLESLGVNVLTEDVPCSYIDTQYYSHRRATHKQQKQSGRMAMLIVKVS